MKEENSAAIYTLNRLALATTALSRKQNGNPCQVRQLVYNASPTAAYTTVAQTTSSEEVQPYKDASRFGCRTRLLGCRPILEGGSSIDVMALV
jgi:hypothetical protein